jgi:hypothetical protein
LLWYVSFKIQQLFQTTSLDTAHFHRGAKYKEKQDAKLPTAPTRSDP